MPLFKSLFAVIACSSVAGEPAAPHAVCTQSMDDVIECEVTGFPACFDAADDLEAGEPSLDGPPIEQGLEEPVSWARGRTHTYIPKGFHASDGSYDLLLHFHGVPSRMQPAFQASDLDHAVMVTVNLGVGSGPYEDRFAAPGSFPRLLDAVTHQLARHAPTRDLRLGHVALSAWSAGYGAIRQILRFDDNRDRVDAVLLADGLHAGFANPRTRDIYAPLLEPFVRFAKEASEGGKLMAISHSSIRTRRYASTTETARYLTQAVGLEEEDATGRTLGPMKMTTSARQRGFRVQGFEGADAKAHVDHLARIDDTLLGQLHGWWESGPRQAHRAPVAGEPSATQPAGDVGGGDT